MTAVMDILNNHGKSQRIYRNMLAFIVPAQDLMSSLKEAARLYLAWKSVKDDSDNEVLNLDTVQKNETKSNLTRSNETIDARIKETYCWLLVPDIDKNVDMKTIVWNAIRIGGGSDGIIPKAAKKMIQDEAVITQWAPRLLKIELDNVLWKDSDHIAIKTLWEYLCTYCYLPRLANEKVLEEAIRSGVNSTEYFAFASGIDNARYIGLKFNQSIGTIERSGYLVKIDVGQKQLEKEKVDEDIKGTNGKGKVDNKRPIPGPTPDPFPEPKNTRYYMSAQLDTTRIGRDIQKLVEEVICHLTSADGAQVEVTLEVNATTPDGFSQQVVRTVSENCRTLRVNTSGFEE